jgi:hypothetical protein
MLDGMRLRETTLQLVRDPVVVNRLDELGAKVKPPTGPSRRELLDAISGA